MKAIVRILPIAFVVILITSAGCEPGPTAPPVVDNPARLPTAYSVYTPEKIDIIPLTEFVNAVDSQTTAKIRVFVSMLDDFGSQMKSPAVFRFELYQHVQRSAEPKGRRLIIWPDTDLTEAAENNKYWRDFLRAYEFDLDFWPAANKDYILQATCLCPNGRRLSADFLLKTTD